MKHMTKKTIDSVSANELLKALNTLQDLSSHQQEIQISFCDENRHYNDRQGGKKAINFEMYMAKKTDKSNIKIQSKFKKSISPLKDSTNYDIKQFKSRSHSPIVKNIDRKQKKCPNPIPFAKTNIANQQKSKQNKQNKKQQNKKVEQIHKISFQSRKILELKQRNGSVYVPIQFRTDDLIKQKQLKLAKLQKEKEVSRILSEKQCTFKPNIIRNYKKVIHAAPKQTIEKKINEIEQEQQSSLRYDSCEENEFLCTPINPSHLNQLSKDDYSQQYKDFEDKDSRVSKQTVSQSEVKRYKNEKFNYLLDLIH